MKTQIENSSSEMKPRTFKFLREKRTPKKKKKKQKSQAKHGEA